MRIAVVGGDLRSLVVGKRLSENGHECFCAGFGLYTDEIIGMTPEPDIKCCLCGAQALILPLPTLSGNGKNVFAPLSRTEIPFDALMAETPEGCLVCGGMLPFTDETHLDYYACEELKIRNAIPTAEGAIGIAFEEMPTTLCGSRTLVLGFGRVGKCLCSRLKALGSNVCVALRKESDRAWAEDMGVSAIGYGSIKEELSRCDAVFNTVPETLLGHDCLVSLKAGSPVIDLASRPGGVDFDEAKALGVRVIWALSLPGKVAPITAGEIIAESILGIFRGRGIGA